MMLAWLYCVTCAVFLGLLPVEGGQKQPPSWLNKRQCHNTLIQWQQVSVELRQAVCQACRVESMGQGKKLLLHQAQCPSGDCRSGPNFLQVPNIGNLKVYFCGKQPKENEITGVACRIVSAQDGRVVKQQACAGGSQCSLSKSPLTMKMPGGTRELYFCPGAFRPSPRVTYDGQKLELPHLPTIVNVNDDSNIQPNGQDEN